MIRRNRAVRKRRGGPRKALALAAVVIACSLTRVTDQQLLFRRCKRVAQHDLKISDLKTATTKIWYLFSSVLLTES